LFRFAPGEGVEAHFICRNPTAIAIVMHCMQTVQEQPTIKAERWKRRKLVGLPE
jgi:hypothetical protein